MSTDTLAVAHIITADAVGKGRPQVIIMTRGEGAEPIGDTINVPADYARDLDEIAIGMRMFGWRTTGEPAAVEPGYFTVDVERTEG